MRKRNNNKAKENKDRWLLTYADMITLLMVFFIVLYAMSNVDAKKYQSLAEVLTDVFSGQKAVLKSSSLQLINEKPSDDEMSEMEKQLKEIVSDLSLVSKVAINYESEGIVLSFQDTVLFKKASAELTTDAISIIKKVTEVLAKVPLQIRVEGNTDNLPINTPQFPSNWELSVARATSVVRVMIGNPNIDPGRISILGHGEYRPVAPNDTPENRQMNRRVDIVILRGNPSVLSKPITNPVSVP